MPKRNETATLEIYRDRKKQYRWRVTASNGRKISVSSEAYKRKIDCKRAIQITVDALLVWMKP